MAKIVVIDDNPQVAEIARQALSGGGHEVVVVNSAFQALPTLRRERPAFVLIDISMPALTGDALVPLIKADPGFKGMTIVLYSALSLDHLRELSAKSGADGFIEKTVRPSELLRRVNEWLTVPP